MKAKQIYLLSMMMLLICSCGQKSSRMSDPVTSSEEVEAAATKETYDEEISAESSDPTPPSALVASSAAMKNKDSVRKFIRTANLKFRVKNVLKSTLDIEDITRRAGGYVETTDLTNEISSVETTAVSADSILETTFHVMTNVMTLRVPQAKLYETLQAISRHISFLNYRNIKAEDVSISLLVNRLEQQRQARAQATVNQALVSGKNAQNAINAADYNLNRQESADNARIDNMLLADKIAYSTISLSIYQREIASRELIPSSKINIAKYEPSFGSRLADAFSSGWNIVKSAILILVEYWGLILLCILIIWGIRIWASHQGNKK